MTHNVSFGPTSSIAKESCLATVWYFPVLEFANGRQLLSRSTRALLPVDVNHAAVHGYRTNAQLYTCFLVC